MELNLEASSSGVVKTFIWKLCSNSLLTKDALHRRHMVPDLVYPMCLHCTETPWHMVWECPASVVVWQECSRPIQKLSLSVDDGLGWFLQMRDRLSKEGLIEAVTVTRLIWLCRNASVFGKEMSALVHVVIFAWKDMENFKSLACKLSGQNQRAGSNTKQWKSPEVGSFKMNWDAAICSSTKAMGVGAVLRDDRGNVMVACASVIPQSATLHWRR